MVLWRFTQQKISEGKGLRGSLPRLEQLPRPIRPIWYSKPQDIPNDWPKPIVIITNFTHSRFHSYHMIGSIGSPYEGGWLRVKPELPWNRQEAHLNGWWGKASLSTILQSLHQILTGVPSNYQPFTNHLALKLLGSKPPSVTNEFFSNPRLFIPVGWTDFPCNNALSESLYYIYYILYIIYYILYIILYIYCIYTYIHTYIHIYNYTYNYIYWIDLDSI